MAAYAIIFIIILILVLFFKLTDLCWRGVYITHSEDLDYPDGSTKVIFHIYNGDKYLGIINVDPATNTINLISGDGELKEVICNEDQEI